MSDSIIMERVACAAADCLYAELLRTEDFGAFPRLSLDRPTQDICQRIQEACHLFFQALCILQGILGNFGKHGAGLSGMFSTGNPLNIGGVVAPEGAQATTEIPAFLMYDVWRDQKWNGEEYPVKALVTAVSVPKGWQRHQCIAGGYAELGSADVDPWGVSAAYYDILCDVRLWKE